MTTETPSKNSEIISEFIRTQQEKELARLRKEMIRLESLLKNRKS